MKVVGSWRCVSRIHNKLTAYLTRKWFKVIKWFHEGVLVKLYWSHSF